MSRHLGSGGPDSGGSGDGYRVVVATVAVAVVLGVAVMLLAVLDPQRLTGSTPVSSGTSPGVVEDGDAPVLRQAPLPGDTLTSGSASTTAPRHKAHRRHGHAGQGGRAGRSDRTLRHRTQELLQAQPTTFRVSTFNVLGAGHTSSHGNKSGRGWASGPARMAGAVALLRSHDVDVVGFQEFERPQYRAFVARTGGGWGVYPGGAGGNLAVRNSIAWRKDTWALVSGGTTPIPYFHGHPIPMPYVLLRNLASDAEVYFVNVHNPATTHRWGNNEHWRDVATAREAQLVRALHAHGTPVVLTGDFNERTEAFCKLTATGLLRAANGGSSGGACVLPGNLGIDWIFGSNELAFSGFLRVRGPAVAHVTDHPFVVSQATLVPPSEG